MKRPAELSRALTIPHDEARARRNWEAIEARRRPARASARSAPWLAGAAVLTGAAMLAAALVAILRTEAGPLTISDGALRGVQLVGPEIGFDDGSQVELGTEAELELLENTGSHVRLWLHRGRTRFDIVPGGPRRWVIESGEVTVEVLGTAFVVERDEAHVRVSVERGSVLVRGVEVPDGMRRLGASESIEVDLRHDGARSVEASDPTDLRSTEDPIDVRAEAPNATEVTEAIEAERTEDAASSEVVESAPNREVDRAPRMDRREPDEAEPSEGAHLEASADEPTDEALDPLVLADRLRVEGRIDEALAVLSTAVDGDGARRERAIAAFTMGRVLSDRQHRYAAAADAFERAIELGLAEPLLEDARARLTEARFSAGDGAGARGAAERYLTHYPDGRWRARVEAWAGAE